MGRVLLLNNAYSVDSMKDTWAKGAGHYSDTMGNLMRVVLEHPPCANLELSQWVACKYLAVGDPEGEKIFILVLLHLWRGEKNNTLAF